MNSRERDRPPAVEPARSAAAAEPGGARDGQRARLYRVGAAGLPYPALLRPGVAETDR